MDSPAPSYSLAQISALELLWWSKSFTGHGRYPVLTQSVHRVCPFNKRTTVKMGFDVSHPAVLLLLERLDGLSTLFLVRMLKSFQLPKQVAGNTGTS